MFFGCLEFIQIRSMGRTCIKCMSLRRFMPIVLFMMLFDIRVCSSLVRMVPPSSWNHRTLQHRPLHVSRITTHLKSTKLDTVRLSHLKYDIPEGNTEGGDPVIVLHGLLGNKKNFHTLSTRLAAQLKKSRKVYCLDLRNHGDYPESHWKKSMSYDSMAADVAAFLESEGIPKAILIGHSMGGKVAQAMALQYPQLVSGLVVMDIAPVKYTIDDGSSWKAITNILSSLNEIPLDTFETKRQIDSHLKQYVEDPALRAFCLTNLGPDLKWKIPLNILYDQLDTLADFDVSGQYTGDTFVIQGGTSRFIRHSHMETISKLFPNYMVTTIRGAGHWVHAEAPDDTLALLQRYLDR